MDEQTELLLRKSAANEQTISSPDLERVPDVFGFHTQQAVEKLLKALLTELGVSHRRTHDVAELVAMVEQRDQPIPATPIALSRLTAFAVQFRYDELPGNLALDPSEARDTVTTLRKHVEGRLREIEAKSRPQKE
jgi:HEPN domain-containing protein